MQQSIHNVQSFTDLHVLFYSVTYLALCLQKVWNRITLVFEILANFLNYFLHFTKKYSNLRQCMYMLNTYFIKVRID